MGGEQTDAGRYILEATNEAGVDSSYIDVVVSGIRFYCVQFPWSRY